MLTAKAVDGTERGSHADAEPHVVHVVLLPLSCGMNRCCSCLADSMLFFAVGSLSHAKDKSAQSIISGGSVYYKDAILRSVEFVIRQH